MGGRTSATRPKGNGPGWGGPAKGKGSPHPDFGPPFEPGNKLGGKPGERAARRRLQADQLMDHLHMIALGQIEAQPVQVQAAQAFMGKVLPEKSESEQTLIIKTGVPRADRD